MLGQKRLRSHCLLFGWILWKFGEIDTRCKCIQLLVFLILHCPLSIGSIRQNDGEIEGEVKRRIQAEWLK